MRLLANLLAICGSALFAGAMLNIGLSFGAYWKSLPPAAFLDWFAENGHLIGRTIPIFLVPTLLGLAASIWFGWDQPGRALWLIAAGCFAGVLAITAVYHLPTNATFAAKTAPLEAVAGTLNTWLTLHAARVALGISAAVFAFLATQRAA